MGFLSELTMVQRAGGAGVIILVLVLLLVKQKQASTAGGSATKVTKETPATTKAQKGGKKGLSLSKGRRSKKGEDLEPVAEPKGGAGRMVPRLPAAMSGDAPRLEDAPAGFDAAADSALAGPVAVPTSADGMISEPGWPTPGEVWAAPDAAATTEFAPVAEPVETFAASADHDDAMDALTGTATTDGAGWATDDLESFDPATGWDTSTDEAAAEPAVAEEVPSWEKEQEEFDWTSTDSWAEPGEDAAEELASAEAAWEAPEDEAMSWTSTDDSWDEPVAETDDSPVATAVVDEPEFTVGDWAIPDAPADEDGGEEPAPIVWAPVDDSEQLPAEAAPAEALEESSVEETVLPEITLEEPVVEAEPVAEVEPAAEDETVVEAAPAAEVEPVVEAEPVAEIEPIVEAEPVAEVEPVVAAEVEPVVEAEPVAEVEPIMAMEELIPAVAEEEVDAMPFEIPVIDEVEEVQEVRERVTAAAEAHDEAAYAAPMAIVAGAAVADPVSRWASMAPGGIEERASVDPVSSWSRLRPGQAPAANGNGHHANGQTAVSPPLPAQAPSDVAVALAPSAAPAVAWWDVPSSMEADPRRGRFALGGYALQPGHQVVSGVTFREGVVPPPSHWVIGPVLGAVAPGTLVLEVDGCLNCRPEDLAVLMDPGFAPTTDGFSLRLAASATGPFAMSGTYVIS